MLNTELILLVVNCCHKQGLQSNYANAGILGGGPSASNFYVPVIIPCSQCPPSYLCVYFGPRGLIRTEPYLQLDNPCCFIKLSWSLQVTEAQLTMSMSQWPKALPVPPWQMALGQVTDSSPASPNDFIYKTRMKIDLLLGLLHMIYRWSHMIKCWTRCLACNKDSINENYSDWRRAWTFHYTSVKHFPD